MKLSILLVARNEEKYIVNCIRSIMRQLDDKLTKNDIEFILVDGCSSDLTVEVAEVELKTTGVVFKIINNQNYKLSPGWNIAIENATAEFVLRPDVHSILLPDYISIGLGVMDGDVNISAVGGLLITQGKTVIGKINALALSTKIGVGNSSFRTGEKSGYYETCVYGIYRKEIFSKVGLFDLSLVRHEDNDMHDRIIKSGGKLYMDERMRAVYYCRESYFELAKQMFRNGYHMFAIPFSKLSVMSPRHFAPMLLLFYLFLALIWDSVNGLLLAFVVYLLTLFFCSVFLAFTALNIKYILITPSLLAIHLSYGLGQLAGIFLGFKNYLKNSSEKVKK